MHFRSFALGTVVAAVLLASPVLAWFPYELADESVETTPGVDPYQRAKEMGHHLMSDQLARRAQWKLENAWRQTEAGKRLTADGEVEKLNVLPPAWEGMPTTGTVRTLTVLIDFKDIKGTVTRANVLENVYGNGTIWSQDNAYPRESVHAYYERASVGQLNLTGDVLDWYTLPNKKDDYDAVEEPLSTQNQRIFDMLKAALDAADATHDFSQYDNDGDGFIDSINIIYAGDPDYSANSFWWGYQWSFFVLDAFSTLYDGVRLRDFTFQWEATYGSKPDEFNPLVIIHETGHSLGLPDYYDYDGSVGPDGGLGGLDMMDANRGNHNAFSRWILDWIEPTIISSGAASSQTLNASGSQTTTDVAYVVFPQAAQTPFQEFFIVENRHRTGNDSGTSNMPSDGLVIWHVDATLNDQGTNYLNDNSYTDEKLIRLVEADGLEEIINNGAADAGDYYNTGDEFGWYTTPSSNAYSGSRTNVLVHNISANGLTMTADIGFSTENALSVNPVGVQTASVVDGSLISIPFTVFNLGPGNLTFDITVSEPWISVATVNGTVSDSPFDVGLFLDPFGLALGEYNGNITIDGDAPNAPLVVPVTFTILPDIGDAVESSAVTWFNDANFPWFEQSTFTRDGIDALQSGDVNDDQTSSLEGVVTGPGTFAFWWSVSSETGWDFLVAYLDDEVVDAISGEIPWEMRTIDVPAGEHTIAFRYIKDTSVSEGLDAGWVDFVAFGDPQVVPPVSANFKVPFEGQRNVTLVFENLGSGEMIADAGIFTSRTVVQSEGFESGPNGWTVLANPNDDLEDAVDPMWHISAELAAEGSFSFFASDPDSGNYQTEFPIRTALISPPITLPTIPDAYEFVFSENYDTEPGFDLGFVEYSTDGEAWLPLSVDDRPDGVSGNSGGWIERRADVTFLQGSPFQLRFYFDTTDPINNQFPGWAVDGLEWRTFQPDPTWLLVENGGLARIYAGQEGGVPLQLDATGLFVGTYNATLRVNSSDPDVDSFDITVSMEVVDPGVGSWTVEQFGDATVAIELHEDFDGDGEINANEYVRGSRANSESSFPKNAGETERNEEGKLVLRYVRARGLDDVVWNYKAGTSLEDDMETLVVDVDYTETAVDNEDGTETVTVTLISTTTEAMFIIPVATIITEPIQ